MHYGVMKYQGKTEKLKATADFIGKATGYVVPPNKAIVGDYGFAHESGIHMHGVLNDSWTYEPYPPELVGNTRRLTIGKQSGKSGIKHKISRTHRKRTNRRTMLLVVERVRKSTQTADAHRSKRKNSRKSSAHKNCYQKTETAMETAAKLFFILFCWLSCVFLFFQW